LHLKKIQSVKKQIDRITFTWISVLQRITGLTATLHG
jgi:hypothetical protein